MHRNLLSATERSTREFEYQLEQAQYSLEQDEAESRKLQAELQKEMIINDELTLNLQDQEE
jgi:hypothetical protein